MAKTVDNKFSRYQQAEKLISDGMSIGDAAKKVGINRSLVQYYRAKSRRSDSDTYRAKAKQAGNGDYGTKAKRSDIGKAVREASKTPLTSDAGSSHLEVEINTDAGAVKVSGSWKAVFKAVAILEPDAIK